VEKNNMKNSTSGIYHDYLIIGAGPAGLQLGYFLQTAGRDYLILERASIPGSFFSKFPRHRQLLSINKIYTGFEDPEKNLRWDWNSLLSMDERMRFKYYSQAYFPDADDLQAYFADFAKHFQLNIQFETNLVRIGKEDIFKVWDERGQLYTSRCLIIATGVSKPYIPPIPGIELTQNYTEVSVDPHDFIGQRVLIIGKGNSGFETAENLVATTRLIHLASPNPVQMAWKTHYVGHLRALNNNILDTYQLKSQNAVLDATIKQITCVNGEFKVLFKYSHASGEEEELAYDRIIACTGFQFDDSIFDDSCKPALVLDNRFPDQTSAWESTNIKGLFFAGVLMQVRDYRKKQSAFIHGFRYNIDFLHRLLEYRYHDREFSYQRIALDTESITAAVIARVNTASDLWQQTDFLCDLLVISPEDDQAKYYRNMPVDYVHESHFGQEKRYYTITLNFGQDIFDSSPNPFALERIHREDTEKSEMSSGLHPIVRRFSRHKLITEHHVIEDLASEWCEEVHIGPLQDFFQDEL
jgi:thioredoxin reductase